MKQYIHRIAAIIATLCIATFFTSSIIVELFGSLNSIALVKSLIVMPGLFILIPAIATTGATGFSLAKNRKGRFVNAKKKRMPIIALNGLFLLLPAAIFLNQWAASGIFDNRFYLVQALELLVGAINLVLMGLNIRDGLKLSAK
ncbi:MAG: hypothetical protein JKY19_04550 [Alcanivoracaceae bacterium]|nr:hypothetical protein [Alcanivoracaceae bacterium]